ncbi:MAG: undecaprenyl-phosphate glucose phosphotransferase [Planctomycetota bacterium]
MLRQTHRAYALLLIAADTVATAGAWIAAYGVRMSGWVMPVTKGIPPFEVYLYSLGLCLPITWFAFRASNLYRARPESSALAQLPRVLRATLLATGVLVVFMFFTQVFDYSRGVVAIFAAMQPVLVVAGRVVAQRVAAYLRERGLGVRRALIVGCGATAQKLVDALRRRPALGIEPVGYVDHRAERHHHTPRGLEVFGGLSALPSLIEEKRIDEVFLALHPRDWDRTEEVLDSLAEEVVDVRVVSSLSGIDTLRATSGNLDGLPIVSLRDTPLRGINVVLKRLLDIAFSGLVLILLSPLFLLVAIAVKLTSKGPVFYRQERMGLDGQTFGMLKFRSMRVDAEKESGAVWAKKDDPRRTPIGTFLRKSSIDELPQFWNVLVGQMSVVGPRPERPVFIDQFRKTIPRYHLRHKMKAGITGWAQVNGLRGDTSLRKRIQYDLYYIRKWSFGFDLWIMFLTVFRGMIAKNAY